LYDYVKRDVKLKNNSYKCVMRSCKLLRFFDIS